VPPVLVRNDVIFKWFLYAAAAVLCLVMQTAFLQRIHIWGVIPFIYPLLAAVPATREKPASGTIFALGVGVVCDLLLPGSIPCLYTLTFPLAGLFASLLSQGMLRAGFLCSLASAAIAFLLTDGFRCLLMWLNNRPAWETGAFLTLREFCVTAPLVIPVTVLFRRVYLRTHLDD